MLARVCVAALASLFLLSTPVSADEADDIPALMERMMTAVESGDEALAWRTSHILLEHDDLERLPDHLLADVYAAAGLAAYFYTGPQMETAEAAAMERFDEAVRLGSRNPLVFIFRGLLSSVEDRAERAASDLLQAEELAPGITNELPSDTINLILFGLRAEGREKTYRAFVNRFYDTWEPAHPFDLRDLLIAEAARLALLDGDVATARERVGEITASSTLLMIQTDREFEPLWLSEGPQLQALLQDALQAQADRYAQAMTAHPGYLEGPLLHADVLARSGDYETAYALSLAAYEQVLEGGFPDDTHEQFATLLSNLASYEVGLGDLEAALQRLEQASTMEEYGVDNVTQRLMLAQVLVGVGRAQDALNALGDYETLALSSAGVGAALAVTACANHLLGETEIRDAAVEALREDFAARADQLQIAYACMDDRDAAAALYIERLQDPRQRIFALDELQEREELESQYRGPLDDLFDAHDEALRSRDDVRAAVAEFGRIVETGVYY